MEEWPLKSEIFAQWSILSMERKHCKSFYGIWKLLGKHQWETHVFFIPRAIPEEILRHPDNNFKTPSEVIDSYQPVGDVDVPHPISWADLERDLSAWLGNPMQDCSIKKLYEFEKEVNETGDEKTLLKWRKLTTSIIFIILYLMV
jgi:alpha-amylase